MTQDDVIETIVDISREMNVDTEYMLKKAFTESRFNPNARNPSGAAGLYQIMPFNVREARKRKPDFDPYDAEDSTRWTANYALQNAKILRDRGFAPTGVNLYLAHQQGPSGVVIVLRAANEDKTIAELPDNIERNVRANIRGPMRGRIRTCDEFVEDWQRYFNSIRLPSRAVALLNDDDGDDDYAVA
jgi:Transglycosylase SLT domain